jgi:two-component system, OmpR family, response regulator
MSPRIKLWTTRRISRKGSVLRALVVDDHPDAADALATYLRFEGMDCLAAYGGKQAIEAGVNWSPDVVVMDISMPECTGFDAALALRHDKRTCAVVIIAFTALDESEVSRHSAHNEFDAYCQKGQSPTRLLELIGAFDQ